MEIDLSLATLDDLNNYVAKQNGKDLSSNDFTNDYKNKLDGIDEYTLFDFKVKHKLLPAGLYYDGTFTDWSTLVSNGTVTVGGGSILRKAKYTISGDLVMPDSITSISNEAFKNCNFLTGVVISDSVTSIGIQVFYNCNDLTFIKIPNNVTSIGNEAFSGCCSLTSIAIPDSVTSIGSDAFSDCESLTSATIPSGVISIGESAFSNCMALTSINIPSGVTSIGGYVFLDCSSLESITVDSNNTTYDSRNNCNAIIETSTNELIAGCKNTIIPSSVTSIGEIAFKGHTGLISINIPSNVTSIGEVAFAFCSNLTSVTIPDSVTTIGDNAFYSVPHIYYNGTATGRPWGARAIN